MKSTIAAICLTLLPTLAFAATDNGSAGLGVVVLGFMFIAYFFPAIIAVARGHANTLAIFVLTLLLGWTGIGWIGALVWACTSNRNRVIA